MITTYLVVWSALTALFPVIATLAVIHGLIGKNRLVLLRMVAGVWVFFVAELIGVTIAGLLWLRLVASLGRGRERFLDGNYRMQRWWCSFLLRTIFRLLDMRFQVEGDDDAATGPYILFMNHTSLIDTLLPVELICRPHGMRLRWVLKKELLIDPCLDIVGNRLPNYFVDRSGVTEAEIVGIEQLASDLGPRDGVMIYPEGTRFSMTKRRRVLDKMKQNSSELYERAEKFEHVLPPRPGGALALLDEARRAGNIDVVFCVHSGMKGFASLPEILSGQLIGTTVRVSVWRVPTAEIPATCEDQITWLYEQWNRVDGLSVSADHDRAA